jgi:hypothetical protein
LARSVVAVRRPVVRPLQMRAGGHNADAVRAAVKSYISKRRALPSPPCGYIGAVVFIQGVVFVSPVA